MISIWRSALLASLLGGVSLGNVAMAQFSEPDRLEALAASLDSDRTALEVGLRARVGQLQHAAEPQLAQEALSLLAPLADRAGMSDVRAELEDASFRLAYPDAFAEMAPEWAPTEPFLSLLMNETEALLAAHGIQGSVSGRTKSMYSTWRKMERKGRPLSQIFDRVALRVIVEDLEDCDRVLALVHQAHHAVAGEFDDYIRNPKANGYQSLHTAVMTNHSVVPAEFQVRTAAMHAAAEGGDAAHWRYKLGA